MFKVLGPSHLIAILYKMCQGTTASILGKQILMYWLVAYKEDRNQLVFSIIILIFIIFLRTQGCCMGTNKEHRLEGRMNGIEIIRWLLYADDLVLF